MASKGPRSKLDHDTRARRQKALEVPKEPPRPKAHWDHVLEEMVWLSKDFESERKWKLAQAKKVSIRASKSVLDFATWGGKKVKEEEHRLKKVAINISKDVKKFWTKIEKLVLYKYQLELEERNKKALDKQLNFLLGQTERYSTMLAENLVDVHCSSRSLNLALRTEEDLKKEEDQGGTTEFEKFENDDDYSIQSDDDLEDDKHTIEEDEAQITEAERRDELSNLQAEADLPLEELLKSYGTYSDVREFDSEMDKDLTEVVMVKNQIKGEISDPENSSNIALPATNEEHYSVGNSNFHHDYPQLHHGESNGDAHLEKRLTVKKMEEEVSLEGLTVSDDDDLTHDLGNETDDGDYNIIDEEEQDDETTLVEEEELTKKDDTDPLNEIMLLQQESEVPLEELLVRYTKDSCSDEIAESGCVSSSSNEQMNSAIRQNDDQDNQNLAIFDSVCKVENPTELTKSDSTVKEVKVIQGQSFDGRESEDIIADAAAAARSAQPTGNTFLTTKVRTKFPFLIKHPLREYQHIGLDWLVTMYEKRLNGILADEMGLGKTIMTIALLAHLACEKGIWGPHLIVVPTSVMLNWETEFLKWCPAFKILTYFGTAKERKHKRQGWLKPNYFHVCITTYRLVIQDSKVFKRKKWKYLILDEAHLIKNWKSQRWQTLLNFNSKRRILLTGTPLQNDLMELWSLLHFLMPHIFQSHQEFKDWFCNPISGMVEGQEKVNKEVLDRLHNVLRPFILRRLKRDVEKQLPKKHEHVIYCRLSKRQRNLYEDFIASSVTQATLASANFFGMISVIMQLRKVCNHPDLFEGRPIVSSFDMAGIDMQLSSLVCSVLSSDPFSKVDLCSLNFLFTQNEFDMTSWEFDEVVAIASPPTFIQETGIDGTDVLPLCSNRCGQKRRTHGTNIFEEIQKSLWDERVKGLKERIATVSWWNSLKCQKRPVYGTNLRKLVCIKHPVFHIHEQKNNSSCYLDYSSRLADIVLSPLEHFHKMLAIIESFTFAIPASRAPVPVCWCIKSRSPVFVGSAYKEECTRSLLPLLSPIRPAIVQHQVYFPDRRLIQFDCGKLQELAVLLRCLKSESHRALIFTQMTKMLDILEAFINLYGYTYLRLDGSTQPEERQTLMQRFNTNPKYFLFILSTRSGGVGVNLVGADTVIFYDSDWNPAMDQQAQDRCHRIGQTREVHIYRLISDSTIEENILKKANQKRALDDLVIQSGSYNTEFFKKLDPMDLFSGHETLKIDNIQKKNSNVVECSTDGVQDIMANVDVEAAIKLAEDEVDYLALKRVEQEEAVDNQEFADDGIGRLEDDELGNEDDMKHDERIVEDQRFQVAVQTKENVDTLWDDNLIEEKALTIAGGDEDIDMLADVKQMAAAAAAAGQASSSFENQLRPIDRYAMRFLELWEPIVDKSAIGHQVNVEEQEWELDRIEKFKEDMEAEIDEDQEPFLYERWDADFATTAYQQHVEALTQRQLLEELECEDLDANGTNKKLATGECKPKKKKKSKKAKFKSLKKGQPTSDAQDCETPDDPMFVDVDDDVINPEDMFHKSPPLSSPQKKRKKGVSAMEEEEANSRKSLKKIKKASVSKNIDSSDLLKQHNGTGDLKIGEGANDLELKLPHRSKVGAKVSITYAPVKRVMLVKPEKLRKKGPPWSKDWLPPPDSWSSQEDAILCAAVHEYGTHWSFVSDALYSMPYGGLYRGRFRHPIHCSERFRELFSKYVLSAIDSSHSEKMNPGLGKALLKVTEDQIRVLLNITSELPNNELLLQKHFVAILSSVWRAKCQFERCQTLPSSRSNNIYSSRINSDSSTKKACRLTEGMNSTNFTNCSRLIQSAIDGDFMEQQERPVSPSSHLEFQAPVDQLDLTLEFAIEQEDSGTSFPYSFCVSIRCPEPLQQFSESLVQHLRPKSTCIIAENRISAASEACIESEGSGWALSAFLSGASNRHKSGSKSQTLGKHKSSSDSTRHSKSKVQRTAELHEDSFLCSKSVMPSIRPTAFEFITPMEVLNLDYDHAFDSYSLESQDMEVIPHDYDPDFYTELEDIGDFY